MKLQANDLFQNNFKGYYKKKPFFGSLGAMNFVVRKVEPEEGNAVFEAEIWPGPLNSENTPEEKKEKKEFAFTAEGLAEAAEWLNEKAEEY